MADQQFLANVLQGGNTVVVHTSSFASSFTTSLHNLYNGIGGVSSTLLGSAAILTAPTLSGTNLYVAAIPTDTYTAAEITVLTNFLTGSGSIFFIGDNSAFPTENNRINAALAALGSAMSIDNTFFDGGAQTATGAQIASDPFTTGVTSFYYAGPSSITLS